MNRISTRMPGCMLMLMAMGTLAPSDAAPPAHQLPLKLRLQTVVVPVRINGGPVMPCILDTGMPAGVFLLDPEAANACQLEMVGQANVTGTGSGSTLANVAMGATVTVEDIQLENQRVIVLDEPGPLAHLGVAGAIGGSLFSEYVVQFDFDAGVVSFYEPDQFHADAPIQLPLTFENTKPVVDASVALDNGKLVSIRLLVDTGAGSALVLHPDSHAQLVAPTRARQATLGAGVGGEIQGRLGRIPKLSLGDHTLTDVVVGFADGPALVGNGTLGMEALRRFQLTIDYPQQRLLLSPNSAQTERFEATMTGLAAKPNTQGEIVVHEVMADSPAAVAGLRAGDHIVTLDGRAVDFSAFRQALEALRQPGQRTEIGFRRQAQMHTTTLTLRRLL